MKHHPAERRTLPAELRVVGRRLEGLAVPFETETRIGSTREIVRRGAFADWLRRGEDIRAFVDHDPQKLLARTRSGSLRLVEQHDGLHFSLDVPGTSLGNDTLAMAEARLLSGMSFAFSVVGPTGQRNAGALRELVNLRLHEISVITGGEPAYPQTSVQARRAMPRRAQLAAYIKAMRP